MHEWKNTLFIDIPIKTKNLINNMDNDIQMVCESIWI